MKTVEEIRKSLIFNQNEQNAGDRGRQIYLDVLRLLATIGVVVLHVSSTKIVLNDGSFNWKVSLVGSTLVQWVVPIFLMISGALFLNPRKDITIKGLLTHSVPRLALAWLFWTAVYAVPVVLEAGGRPKQFNMLFHFHLWFLPMLTGIYLLVPLLRKVASEAKLSLYALALWMLCFTVMFIGKWNIPQVTDLFSLGLVAAGAGYFLMGGYAAQFRPSKQVRWGIYMMGIVALVVSVVGTLTVKHFTWGINTKYLSTSTPHVVLMSLALFVFVRYNARRFGRWMELQGLS